MNDNTMWALVKEKTEKGLWMKRVPIPEVGPTDVKIKIHICTPNTYFSMAFATPSLSLVSVI